MPCAGIEIRLRESDFLRLLRFILDLDAAERRAAFGILFRFHVAELGFALGFWAFSLSSAVGSLRVFVFIVAVLVGYPQPRWSAPILNRAATERLSMKILNAVPSVRKRG